MFDFTKLPEELSNLLMDDPETAYDVINEWLNGEVVGYFSYDCQDDGYCTYGCGKVPTMLCAGCMGEVVPDNYHPITRMDGEDFLAGICDKCDEAF
jgi:hypothetical protein